MVSWAGQQSLEWAQQRGTPPTIGGAKKMMEGTGEHANGKFPGAKNQMCHKSQ
jgi:hypothetical protein